MEAAALTISILAMLIAGMSAYAAYRMYRIERDRRADEQREQAADVVPSFSGTAFVLTNRGASTAFNVAFYEESGQTISDMPIVVLHPLQSRSFVVGQKMLGAPTRIPVIVSWEDESGNQREVRYELSR